MKSKRKFIIVGLWILSVVLSFNAGMSYEHLDFAFEPLTETEPLIIKGQIKGYVKKYSWGLLGNHSIVYLTNSRERTNIDESKDQILTKSSSVFFEVKNDILTIYCRTSPDINPNFKSDLDIKYVKLSNPEFMNLYDQINGQLKCSDGM